jgi:hypothetical protein
MTTDKPYDYRNCSSLFGYSAGVHARSGGICTLCGAGEKQIDFDIWRQLTVEHLIGESQGGYKREISSLVAETFPHLDDLAAKHFTLQIDELNTVSACHFCNSTTSRMQSQVSMRDLFGSGKGGIESITNSVREACEWILAEKQCVVAWKLQSVREAYDSQVKPRLESTRSMTA